MKTTHFITYLLILGTPLTVAAVAQAESPTTSPSLAPSPALSLTEYIEQVRAKNTGIVGAAESSEASLQRSKEGELATSPQFFANATWASDTKQSASTILYDKVVNHNYTLGIQQMTSFGLSGKVSVGWNYTNFYNPMIFTGTGLSPYAMPAYYESRPAIELSQSIWGGGFGKTVRSQMALAEAQALASHYGNRFQIKGSLAEAESIYWRLALARQTVTIQKDALERANKIYEWNQKRVQMHLTDASDALQSKALLEIRRLELTVAQDELGESARTFNSLRGIESDTVTETILELGTLNTDDLISKLAPPPRAPMRDDVKAAEQAERLTQANSDIAYERNLPTLDVFGSYAINGNDPALTGALSNSFSANRPTQAVGLRLNVPLGLSLTKQARSAWAAERIAAEKTFQRKLFDQEHAWRSLLDRFNDAKKRLDLSRSLEKIQEEKLSHERDRLQRGRTVTYQVLMFEQDFAQAQLNRIRTQTEVLNLFAQMKLFQE